MIKKISIIVSFTFIGASVIELVFSMILALTELSLDEGNMILGSLIVNLDLMPLETIFLWLFLQLIICFFLILGITLLLVITKKQVPNDVMAKYLVLTGILILILSFIKLEYIVLLGKTEINGLITFENALYDLSISPAYAAVMWIFYTAVVCSYLIIGLVVAAVGLQWTLESEKKTG